MGPKCKHKCPFKEEAERDFTQKTGDRSRERFEDAMTVALEMRKGL